MGIRYRKNINCLSENELHALREALAQMYVLPESDHHGYAKLAGIHGLPAPQYCIHGYPGFLTWHRAYMLAFEEALRRIDCGVTLPYWDWSSGPTTGLPPAVSSPTYVNRTGDEVPNPLYSGPIPASVSPAGSTSRSPTVSTRDFGPHATSAQNAFANADFDDFQPALYGPHGSVHIAVGGEMGGVAFAGYDPIFYMHHANVDRIWADWQKVHPAPLPADEQSLALDPFAHSIGGALKTGAEMFSTVDLGYRYLRWCFRPLPWPFDRPLQILELVPIRTLEKARLVLKAERMPAESAELRVFVNDEEIDSRVGFFGGPTGQMRTKSDRFDQLVDVTAALKRCKDARRAELRLEAVSAEGKPVDLDKLNVSGLELQLEHH